MKDLGMMRRAGWLRWLGLPGWWLGAVVLGMVLPVYGQYGPGTGEPNNPYQIWDPNQMNAIGANPGDWGKCFKLMADIDLSVFTGTQYKIIGYYDDNYNYIPFTGTFDGNGHIIINLTYTTTTIKNSVGLFGYINNATIKNVRVENVLVSSNGDYVGGIVGRNRGIITDCYVTGSVTGGEYSECLGGLCGYNWYGTIINSYATSLVNGYSALGGLCGKNYYGTINNCHATGSVTGEENNIGGLCGWNEFSTIDQCYATGPIAGVNYVGGLCGYNIGTITSSYATGQVAGTTNVGGLCGSNRGIIINGYATGLVTGVSYLGGLCGYNGSTIINGYATGSVTGANNLGGLCGYQSGDGAIIVNCFWDTQTSGMLTGYNLDSSKPGIITNVVGLQTELMQTESTFTAAGWDFVDEILNGTHQLWQMPIEGGHPVLSYFNGYIPVVLSGQGSLSSPYLINNAVELGAMYYYDRNAYYRLQADIDLSGIQWSTAVIPVFGGDFDGNGHTIHNLMIDTAGANLVDLGLFGKIDGATAQVKNLGLENFNIMGGNYSSSIGGLCGQNYYGTIANCHTTGSVTGYYNLGDLCGYNLFGIINSCYTNGSVFGGDSSTDGGIGGLCGHNLRGTITNCYATGSVSGPGSHIGGLVGEQHFGTIGGCYATSSVSGGNVAGGLSGINNEGTIINSYAAGSVIGGGSLGGLSGGNSGTIDSSYATGSVTGNSNLGGLIGSNDGTITNSYATGSVTGDNKLGGLCGNNWYGLIINSYATGLITGVINLGGLCGHQYGDTATIVNSFWDTETSTLLTGYNLDSSEPGTITNVVGLQTDLMQTESTFTAAGWDFVDEITNGTFQIWQMPTEGGYPVLSYLNGYTPAVLSGDGTPSSPYLISNEVELGATYYYDRNACYKLQADIELSGIQWSTAVIPVFGGVFDGNGHTIRNLTIDTAGLNYGYLGLFGKIDGVSAEVKNLGIENCNIVGGDDSYCLGGLCGGNTNGTITNCYATGSVTAGNVSDYLGSLCGGNTNGTITKCYAAGSVIGGNYIGGLCGGNTNGTITKCYATGSVIGSSYLGGLCGSNGGTITNNYAAGSVIGGSYIGGLCGYNESTITRSYATGSVTGGSESFRLGGLCGYNDRGTILNSYTTGLISGASSDIGGAVGKNYYGTFSGCFWDTQTSGQSVGVGSGPSGGVIGKTTAEMMKRVTFTSATSVWWDFTEGDGDPADWMMLREGEDYPRLAWQEVYGGDIAGRYGVGMEDLLEVAGNWLEEVCPAGCEEADINGDGRVDLEDFAVLAGEWLRE